MSHLLCDILLQNCLKALKNQIIFSVEVNETGSKNLDKMDRGNDDTDEDERLLIDSERENDDATSREQGRVEDEEEKEADEQETEVDEGQ